MSEEPDSQSPLAELELIYRSAPIGLCFIDPEFRYVRINEHLAAINGKPANEHIGKTIREMVPEIAELVEPIYRSVFENGEPVLDMGMRGVTEATPRAERPYRVSIFPVSRDGHVIGVNTMVQDISQDEIIQQELRRGAQILSQVHDAVVTTDMDGIVRTWNDAAERIYGYTAREAIGRKVDFLQFPRDLVKREEKIMDPLRRRGSHEVLMRNRRKDGSEIFIELRLSTLQDESGVPIGLIGCSNDVTERRRLQEELLKVTTSEQRRIGQELHDVTGQELTGLRYLSRSLVRMLEKDSAAGAELVIKIEEGLGRVLGQVREMARGLVPVEVDAEGLMAALSTLARRTSAIDEMACTFVCDAPTPIGNNEKATQLFRIAQEAVTNAIKHGRAKTIRIELARQDDLLTLAILDDGVGLEPASPSTGLGLRIMNFRAEMIGAELTLKPGRKGGTKITCSLPVSD